MIDLSRSTSKTVHPYLYGYATGALLDKDFLPAANGDIQASAEILSPVLIRLNTPVTNIIQSVFAKGVSHPDWSHLFRWTRHRSHFARKGSRLIFGIGPAGNDTSIPPATWAKYAKATALHFRKIGQDITYWEAGNECDAMGAAHYSKYFNAISDALHSVDPAYLVGGPVSSWWNGIDLPTFIHHSGSRIGFIDFHSYPVNNNYSTRAAYEAAVTLPNVASARQAAAGTVAAHLPIGLLEYNMNPDQQPNGDFGLPAQGTLVGAVYVALLLTHSFKSDTNFTMGGLWDLAGDSNYGAIGNAQDGHNYRVIDPQGWYLRQAAKLMPGQHLVDTTTGPDLQVLATKTSRRFSIQLVNYNVYKRQSVTISVKGHKPGSPITQWELSARHTKGQLSTIPRLGHLTLPPQSIVILNGRR